MKKSNLTDALDELILVEELKYAEIAAQLQLSIKTVENQIGKALKILRVALAEYLISILLILLAL